ncbi:MAG: phosphoribosylformylglycinamidine synthase subunit PurQ [Marinosulfonomonas sp.]|nr:phosphoribosylformylglycinamidine synthase subunit PurQ [Marinosulfonomonas sp.]
MRAGVIVFPGSNCDRDLAVAFRQAGADVSMIWHKDVSLPDNLDVIGIPGGFSFGDYLRCGAIAARSPICSAVVEHAKRGGYVIGICNGFQVLCETGLLPGTLMRNSGIKFVCKTVGLRVQSTQGAFMQTYETGQEILMPVAHHDGNYTAEDDLISRLDGEGRVAFRYLKNPNGSADDIAGVLSANKRVLGLMPHPERAVDGAHGGTDGTAIFAGLASVLENA